LLPHEKIFLSTATASLPHEKILFTTATASLPHEKLATAATLAKILTKSSILDKYPD
jgi:hypothetical protein